ncbi:hypothetical protein [Pseudozobellia thermophila]|nr:hypothetical protein [Pseudozobellia thermophila]
MIHSPLTNKKRKTLGLALLLAFVLWSDLFALQDVQNDHHPSHDIELNSFGFNAKKRSGFVVAGHTEHVERGLTLVHFNSGEKYEFKTFDTYASAEACQEFIAILRQLTEKKAVFAILAHDSAANAIISHSSELKALGYPKLVNIKGRQAYAMHNFQGHVYEQVDDLQVRLHLEPPNRLSDANIYFPKIKYEFEPGNDRYIAHAAGEIEGVKSTNSKEALDLNYRKGFRFFELDIIKTSDGKFVAAHDWNMWSRFTDYKGSLPPTHEEFVKHKIYGAYHTLDMEGINSWFKAHPDAVLVTDKINDPMAFASAFVDKQRLIMELFSPMAIEQASKQGIKAMISQEPLLALKGDRLDYLALNQVEYAAVSRRIIARNTKLMQQLKDQGVKVYVYHVNFDPGKDEKYVYDNELGLVYGMYADQWAFGPLDAPKVSK